MNPIDREICRRVFWLCYGGEKSMGVMENQPIVMNQDDYGDVALPMELCVQFSSSPPGQHS
jgi:hypothetical protein